MTDLSFQSYNAIPDFFQTKLSPTFFYISKDKISKQTKRKNISLTGFMRSQFPFEFIPATLDRAYMIPKRIELGPKMSHLVMFTPWKEDKTRSLLPQD
jgi:hypothetical protein